MSNVGADPAELRRLAAVLMRAVDEAGWLRRRIDEAEERSRLRVDTRALVRLEAWLADSTSDVRRRAARLEDGWPRSGLLGNFRPPGVLEDGWVANGGLLDDFRPPAVTPGGCGSVQLPVVARRAEPGGRVATLGEPLFASAPLSCAVSPPTTAHGGFDIVVGPNGTLLLATRSGRRAGGGGAGGGGGGPAPGKPTKKEALDKLRLPPSTARFGFLPPKRWRPDEPLGWNREHRGYKDAKGDVWRKGPSRTPGDPFEWDVQLKRNSPWVSASKDGQHLNVDLRGKITH